MVGFAGEGVGGGARESERDRERGVHAQRVVAGEGGGVQYVHSYRQHEGARGSALPWTSTCGTHGLIFKVSAFGSRVGCFGFGFWGSGFRFKVEG